MKKIIFACLLLLYLFFSCNAQIKTKIGVERTYGIEFLENDAIRKFGENNEQIKQMRSLSYKKIIARLNALGYQTEEIVQDANSLNRRMLKIFNVDDESFVNSIIQTTGKFDIWETYCDYDRAKQLKDSLSNDNEIAYLLTENLKFNDDFSCRYATDTYAHLLTNRRIVYNNYWDYLMSLFSKHKIFENLQFMRGIFKNETPIYTIKTGKNGHSLLNENYIKNTGIIEQDDKYQIVVQFDEQGTLLWQQITKDNFGKQIAVSIDDCVYSCAIVNKEITNGKVEILMSFGKEEAEALSVVLKSGALPLSCFIVLVY